MDNREIFNTGGLILQTRDLEVSLKMIFINLRVTPRGLALQTRVLEFSLKICFAISNVTTRGLVLYQTFGSAQTNFAKAPESAKVRPSTLRHFNKLVKIYITVITTQALR